MYFLTLGSYWADGLTTLHWFNRRLKVSVVKLVPSCLLQFYATRVWTCVLPWMYFAW